MAAQSTVYTSRETAYGADATLRRINLWASTGFIEPSINHSSGRGDPRGYSETDIHLCAILGTITCRGVALKTLQPAARFLRECDSLKLKDPRARLVLTPDARDVSLLSGDESVVSFITRSGPRVQYVIIQTGTIIKEVAARISKIHTERAAKAASLEKAREASRQKLAQVACN